MPLASFFYHSPVTIAFNSLRRKIILTLSFLIVDINNYGTNQILSIRVLNAFYLD